MNAGDREIAKASEEVATRNVLAAIQHSNETRKIVKELATILDALQNRVRVQNEEIKQLREQLSKLQQQFYLKGTPSYNDGT
jgi:chaperonin cofactor prefoldin